MKFVDEFRDPAAARKLLAAIEHLAGSGPDHFKFMEVCGGHTHTIYRHGIEHLLPDNVELVHGPGCPVCVIPMGRIDDAMWLAGQPDVIFTCFGDMMRVPGSNGSLLDAKARGADVRFVYSPLDALKVAVDNPDKHVVFFAIGFETTAPSTAVTLVRARDLGLRNFSVFCNHVTIVPPIKAILESPDLRLSGFIGPGHVSTVVGNRPYRFVPEVYGKPLVVAGFEPLDILAAVAMLLRQIREGRCEVENQYKRVVPEDGNPAALALMGKVFALRPHFEWRGLGFISQSALRLHDDFAEFDAELRYAMPGVRVADPKACQCGEVLKGVLKPWECKVFGTACTPETPIGTCMVSPEGACAAYYNFGRMHRDAAKLVGPIRAGVTVGPGTSRGAEMFARYAYAPNALGYCGPPLGATLRDGSVDDVRRAATQFSGAWPYLRVLAKMTGISDPLDYRLVESYWLGGGIGAELDAERIRRRVAGHHRPAGRPATGGTSPRTWRARRPPTTASTCSVSIRGRGCWAAAWTSTAERAGQLPDHLGHSDFPRRRRRRGDRVGDWSGTVNALDAVRAVGAPARRLGRRVQRGARRGRRRRDCDPLGPAVRPVATRPDPCAGRQHQPPAARDKSAAGARLASRPAGVSWSSP